MEVILSQKEGVGGSGGLGPSLGGHTHEGLRHGHGGGDANAHPCTRTYTSHGTSPHSRHHAAHGSHSSQRDHGDGLSRQGRNGHGLSHATEPSGHGADTHLVEGRRNWLAHLEGVGMGCWSRSRSTLNKGQRRQVKDTKLTENQYSLQ